MSNYQTTKRRASDEERQQMYQKGITGDDYVYEQAAEEVTIKKLPAGES